MSRLALSVPIAPTMAADWAVHFASSSSSSARSAPLTATPDQILASELCHDIVRRIFHDAGEQCLCQNKTYTAFFTLAVFWFAVGRKTGGGSGPPSA